MVKPSNTSQVTPTRFVVESLQEGSRKYRPLIVAVAAIVMALVCLDPQIERDHLWILGGLGVGLALLETAPYRRAVKLTIEIGPLGIQRTSETNSRVRCHPLIPRSQVRDCILTEHVQAFSVTTHLVFRVGEKLIPAFPKATLTFEQCHSMLQEIQQALRET